MHEMIYVEQLYKAVNAFVKQKKFRKVLRIFITVHQKLGIEKQTFQEYWRHITKDSMLGHSIVIISYQRPTYQCLECGQKNEFEEEHGLVRCVRCRTIKILENDPYVLRLCSIEGDI